MDKYQYARDDIRVNLLFLAATTLELDKEFIKSIPNFEQRFSVFKIKWRQFFSKKITTLKEIFFEYKTPIPHEFMELLTTEPHDLYDRFVYGDFEAPEDRIHPDIYMNEILEGLRDIQEILPKVLEVLEKNKSSVTKRKNSRR